MDRSPPEVTTTDVRRLVAGTGPAGWLVFAPDRADFRDGHIPGSLGGVDLATLVGVADGAPVVVYGEDERAAAAPRLVDALVAAGVDAAWFAGGLRSWVAAGGSVEASAGPRADRSVSAR